MKKSLKFKAVMVLLIVISLVLLNTTVNAYTVGMALTSSSKLVEGGTVTVSVNLTTIDAGDGISGISAELDYDTDVFETIKSSDIVASNDWSVTYVESSNMMSILKNTKVTTGENVLKITLKVKSTINADSTKITLKNTTASGGLTSAGGTGNISVANANVTISKESAPSSGTETITNTTKVNTTTTTAGTKLPYTGMDMSTIVVIAVVAIFGTVSFVLYKKTSKDVK